MTPRIQPPGQQAIPAGRGYGEDSGAALWDACLAHGPVSRFQSYTDRDISGRKPPEKAPGTSPPTGSTLCAIMGRPRPDAA